MACTTCQKRKKSRSKVSGMSKKSKKITEALTTAIAITGGYVAANLLTSKVSFLNSNPAIKAITPIAAGFLVGGKKGSILCAAGKGMMAAGIVEGVKVVAPTVASQIGIAGFSKSSFTPGVAGGAGRFIVD